MDNESGLLAHYPSDLAALCQRIIALEASADITPVAAAVLRDTLEELAQQHEALGEARQTAELARAHCAALFTLAPDGYLVTDTFGLIQAANHAAATLLHVPPEELIGKPLIVFVAPADSHAFMTQLPRLTALTRVQNWEVQLKPLGEEPIPADITVTVSGSTAETETRLLWLVRDLSTRKRLEAELRRAEHFTLLGKLAAGISHELRNPLGAIFLQADLLQEELHDPSPDSPEAMTQALTDMKTQLTRIDDLVQNYLSLARVPTLERTPHDLGTTVRAWVSEMQELAAARGVTFQLDGLDGLGTVAVHPSSLRRVLLNLVQNALDAMPQGGTIMLRGQGTATQVQLQVRDTGSGIPAEQLPKLFEPLYTTKSTGTGLGLYIVHEIVAAHEGQVAVQSVEGQGTTFTITLPRAGG